MYIKILLKLIIGYYNIEIEGYYIEKFINLCQKMEITIWNVKKINDVKIKFNVGINDLEKMSDICDKLKCNINIKSKRGLPFLFTKYKKRKIFVIIFILILIFIINISQFIWNIKINVKNEDEVPEIEKDLNDLGINKGIYKKNIDKNKIATEIKLKRSDISWIGIDIKGTNLIINIVKSEPWPEIVDNSDFSNIVATKSGKIEKIIAQNGTPLVKKGDYVHRGDILIGGFIDGKHTERRFVHSLGEVEAIVFYTKTEKIPLNSEILYPSGKKEKKFSIKFNNFQINFQKTLSKFQIYDTIYTEKNLKIFPNFYLPISIVKITNNELTKKQINYNIEEAKNIGIEDLQSKIEKQIENKENILQKNVDIKQFKNYIEVSLTYEVLENIGTYEKLGN